MSFAMIYTCDGTSVADKDHATIIRQLQIGPNQEAAVEVARARMIAYHRAIASIASHQGRAGSLARNALQQMSYEVNR